MFSKTVIVYSPSKNFPAMAFEEVYTVRQEFPPMGQDSNSSRKWLVTPTTFTPL